MMHFMAPNIPAIWRSFTHSLVSRDQAISLIDRLLSTPGGVTMPDFPFSITLAELGLQVGMGSVAKQPAFPQVAGGAPSLSLLTAI